MPTTKSRTSRPTRSNPPQPHDVATVMLGWLGLELVSCKTLQTLWAGYGHICAVTARPAPGDDRGRSLPTRLILKLISPPTSGGDEGHLRKILSYEVEQHFYAAVAPHLAADVAVAQCLASTYNGRGAELAGVTAMLLTDLRPAYPVAGEKRGTLDARQVHAAITWLANLHGGSRGARTRNELDAYLLPPLLETERRRRGNGGSKLWLNGGYTYLATRQTELADLQADARSEWSTAFCTAQNGGVTVAQAAARFLTPRGRPIESTIHGDVKSENLFATAAGDKVAFFDFQYVGLGLGVCDLAKLFTCSVPLGMLIDGGRVRDVPHVLQMAHGERALLETYRTLLLQRAAETCPKEPHEYPWDTLVRHWETALVDWCRFQASWGFWGNEEWLAARVRSILADQGWRTWLRDELATIP